MNDLKLNKKERREWVLDQMLALSECSSVARQEWLLAYRAICRAWRHPDATTLVKSDEV